MFFYCYLFAICILFSYNIDNKYYHLILLAKNNEGYKNLIKLVSYGFTVAPFYTIPTLDADGNKVPLDIIIDQIKSNAERNGYPIDGAVFKFDDIKYGKCL